MKSEEILQKLQQSSEYRAMYREIIHTQIQTLIDNLAVAGVESVLLMACTYDSDITDKTTLVGTELGKDFLNLQNLDCRFKEYCLKNKHVASEKVLVSQTPGLIISKRKFSEISDALTEDSSEAEQTTPRMECKRSRSLTPSLKSVQSENIQSRAAMNMYIPKGHSKCSLCNYVSKFKANVTRHERSVHKINIEGATLVTAQYTCALCEYKSTYRANLIRHEKSVHKVVSTNAEIESRKIRMVQNGDGSPFSEVVLGLHETDAGNQLYLNQTDSIVSSDGNQSYDNENGFKTENLENQSNMETCEDEDINGCHICNYCQLIYISKAELLEHVDSVHPKTSLLDHEKTFDSETGLVTQNAQKQEVCRCGKAFQYRTSLMRHEKKCEFLTTNQGNECKEECSEAFKTDSLNICDKKETKSIEREREEIEKE